MLIWSKKRTSKPRRLVPSQFIVATTVAISVAMVAPSPHATPSRLVAMTSSAPQPIQKLIERQARGWENADADTIVEDFAEEALFVVPGTVFRGKAAIKAAAEDYFAQFSQTQVTIKRIVVDGNEGVVEWSWSDVNDQTGKTSNADDAIVFELKNGKIVYWREYIDTQSPTQE